jgi:hypothetical protein
MISLLRTLLLEMETTIPELSVVGVRSPSEPTELQLQVPSFLFASFQSPGRLNYRNLAKRRGSNPCDPLEPSGSVNCPFHRPLARNQELKFGSAAFVWARALLLEDHCATRCKAVSISTQRYIARVFGNVGPY